MMNALNLFIGFSLYFLPTDLLSAPVCGPCGRADQSKGFYVRISTSIRLQARLRARGTYLKKTNLFALSEVMKNMGISQPYRGDRDRRVGVPASSPCGLWLWDRILGSVRHLRGLSKISIGCDLVTPVRRQTGTPTRRYAFPHDPVRRSSGRT